MALADAITLPSNLKCLSSSLPLAIQHVKQLFGRFVDGLEASKAATNHSLAFETALQTIRKVGNVEDTVLLIYISRGLLTSLEEAKVVLNTIAKSAQIVPSKVMLSSCALVDGELSTFLFKSVLKFTFACRRQTAYDREAVHAGLGSSKLPQVQLDGADAIVARGDANSQL
jgi:hypothetical protein